MEIYRKVLLLFSAFTLCTAPLLGHSSKEVNLVPFIDSITRQVHGELTFETLPKVLHDTCKKMDQFTELSPQLRRQAVLAVLSHVIDNTNTPHLPDGKPEPLMKGFIFSFVDFFSTEEDFSPLSNELMASYEYEDGARFAIEYSSTQLIWYNQLSWNELSLIIRIAIQFASQFDDQSWERRAAVMKQIVNTMIDNTNIPYTHHGLSDSIVKTLGGALIDEYVLAKSFDNKVTFNEAEDASSAKETLTSGESVANQNPSFGHIKTIAKGEEVLIFGDDTDLLKEFENDGPEYNGDEDRFTEGRKAAREEIKSILEER